MNIFAIVSTVLVILVLLLGTQADKFRAAVASPPAYTSLRSVERLTPDALTYYCAGHAEIPLHGTVSAAHMERFVTCIDQHKHRLLTK